MVSELTKAERLLASIGTHCGVGANMVKNRTMSMKNGAPGGCPTSNLLPLAINSLQSQKLAVGSMVSR